MKINFWFNVLVVFFLYELYQSEFSKLCLSEEQFNEKYQLQINSKLLKQIQSPSNLVYQGKFSKVIKITLNNDMKVIAKVQLITPANQQHLEEVIEIRKTLKQLKEYFYELIECIFIPEKKLIIQINEIMYQSLNQKDKDKDEFFENRNFSQRLDNYIHISKGLIGLKKNSLVHQEISPKNIMSTDSSFQNLKIIDMNQTGYKNEIANVLPSIYNVPILNDTKKTINSNLNHDCYSLVMTIAIKELNSFELKKTLEENYIDNYKEVKFKEMKKIITDQLKNQFVQKKQVKRNLFFKILKKIKNFIQDIFYHVNYLDDCQDLICLVKKTIVFDEFTQPTIDEVYSCLLRIKNNFQEEDLIKKQNKTTDQITIKKDEQINNEKIEEQNIQTIPEDIQNQSKKDNEIKELI